MNEIAQALALNDFLLWIWRSGVWVSAALMLALSALVFIRPALIHRWSGTMLAITAIPMLFLHRFQRRPGGAGGTVHQAHRSSDGYSGPRARRADHVGNQLSGKEAP